MSRPGRVGLHQLALFTSLYAVQGVVVAYFFNFNKAYMNAAGVGNEQASLAETLALLPFVFKFLFGPLSDRVNFFGWGHRKPYIILGILVQTLGLAGLAFVDPGPHFVGFVALAVLTVLGLALYDTCCDGLVIDVTPPADRARVQGSLMVSRFLATMVCTLAFGYWLESTGTGPGKGEGVLWACAGLGLIPLLLAVPLPEARRADDAEVFQWSALRVLILPRSLVLLAFGALYALVGVGAEINLSAYYHSLQFGQADVGMLAAPRYLGRALGASLLPLASSRLHRRSILTIGIVGLVLTTAGQALVHARPGAGVMGFLFGAANGWDDALFCVLAMEASDPRMAASTYALFMAVSNLSVAGDWLFAKAVAVLNDSFRLAYVLSALLTAVAMALVPSLCRPAHAEAPDASAA